METVRTTLIVSGLPDNAMDWHKVEEFSEVMVNNDIETGHWGFPPIKGFWGEITNKEVGMYFCAGFIEDMEEITKKDLGKEVFFVTDGHHRAYGAQRAKIWDIEWELDTSGYVANGERN